jgi:predicted outer membrane lipoprotein
MVSACAFTIIEALSKDSPLYFPFGILNSVWMSSGSLSANSENARFPNKESFFSYTLLFFDKFCKFITTSFTAVWRVCFKISSDLKGSKAGVSGSKVTV